MRYFNTVTKQVAVYLLIVAMFVVGLWRVQTIEYQFHQQNQKAAYQICTSGNVIRNELKKFIDTGMVSPVTSRQQHFINNANNAFKDLSCIEVVGK